MSTLAIESERQLLSCLDDVMDAPASERRVLVRSRIGDDERLVRELERLVAAAERPDATFLAESVELMLQPVLADLADHAVTTAEIPIALGEALAPRYTVLERIGRGGMASVYLAFDKELGRHVAIKWLRPELADGIGLERFEREIAIAATVDHPHIVPVYERGIAHGLLYYVMRYVDGGSLRDLLLERPELEIRKAIDIARDVAEALDAAHAKKIVHRDIKPANILLDKHGAHLADFGVARLVDAAGREHRTRSGIALGTARYMSPEQAGSATKVDGRSDVYSLGCVLYEMLAGEPPFTGPTQRDIMAKHLAAAIPDLTVVRATVTRSMQQVIATALQKAPADRFASAGEFIDAFERAYQQTDGTTVPSAETDKRVKVHPSTLKTRIGLRRASLTTAGMLVVGLGAWRLSSGIGTPQVDPGLHVVFPFDVPADVGVDAAQRLREAMAKWTGIRVVAPRWRDRTLVALGILGLNDKRATATARSMGARGFIRGNVQLEGKVLGIVAKLYDVDSGLVADVHTHLRGDLADTDSVIAVIAERLVLRNKTINQRVEASLGTRENTARQAYMFAHAAIREWNLARADSIFLRAVKLDPNYPQSSLWLAQVRYWRDEPSNRWRDYVDRALSRRLTVREQNIAQGLRQWGENEVTESCNTWERLAASDPENWSLWYSAYTCRSRDDVVVPDAASPSGWRWRSSYRLALAHLERALRLNPAIYRGFRDNAFEQLRLVLKTGPNLQRRGRSVGGQSVDFTATPRLFDDTIGFVPYPMSEQDLVRDVSNRFSSMRARAVEHQRQLFRKWTIIWASNYPQSSDALEAVAMALEALGEVSALDTIARARELARGPAEQQRLAATQAWLLVKFLKPSDLTGLRRARMIVDSVLRPPALSPGDRRVLVTLAALTGRLSLAMEHARFLTDWPRREASAQVNDAGAHLLLHAALGGPAAGLRALERRADSVISLAPDSQRLALRRVILGKAAELAFPAYVMSALTDSSFSFLGSLIQRWQRGDKAGVLRTLNSGRSLTSSSVGFHFDWILPRARLVDLAAGSAEAARWMDVELAAIGAGSHYLLDPVGAASLVSAMVFRADLASRTGDQATAAKWAAAVAELWADCDPVLWPVRDRMRSLAR